MSRQSYAIAAVMILMSDRVPKVSTKGVTVTEAPVSWSTKQFFPKVQVSACESKSVKENVLVLYKVEAEIIE